uniref:non-specific serine/threonine protein kinase n=1 Tax=Timema californicum TaxID=61474 RepID=A0A7R9IZI9_TIMCA|nr:unnamed protein product [Timema californicum]
MIHPYDVLRITFHSGDVSQRSVLGVSQSKRLRTRSLRSSSNLLAARYTTGKAIWFGSRLGSKRRLVCFELSLVTSFEVRRNTDIHWVAVSILMNPFIQQGSAQGFGLLVWTLLNSDFSSFSVRPISMSVAGTCLRSSGSAAWNRRSSRYTTPCTPGIKSLTACIASKLIEADQQCYYDHNAKRICDQLVKDVTTCGRASTCDIVITDEEASEKVLGTISKKHFRILKKTFTVDGDTRYNVFLEDLSSNGTFINKNLVGKGSEAKLHTNDRISISSSNFQVFVFFDGNMLGNLSLPREIWENYDHSRRLGKGAFAEVFCVFQKKTGKKFAMKVVSKEGFKHKHVSSNGVMNEVNILKAVDHPFIVKLEEVVETKVSLFIILEAMDGGDLQHIILPNVGLNESEVKFYFYQIVLAVQYLHEKGIIHRDLKPSNILMASEKMKSIVKVTDFGLSKFINEETLATTYCGSPHYVAPEILQNKGHGSYTKKVDVWSLGLVLYDAGLLSTAAEGQTAVPKVPGFITILAGYFPFKDSDTLRLINEIVHGLYSFNKKPWTKVSDDAKNLIQKMMTLDPEKRLSINEVLNHQWLKDKDLKKEVKNLLKKNKNDYNQKQFYRTQLNKQGRRLTSGSNSDETVGPSPKKVKQGKRFFPFPDRTSNEPLTEPTGWPEGVILSNILTFPTCLPQLTLP